PIFSVPKGTGMFIGGVITHIFVPTGTRRLDKMVDMGKGYDNFRTLRVPLRVPQCTAQCPVGMFVVCGFY
ncbi:MAG TPA: hypothetical protein VFQ59_02250, partial [Candidatus Paceibacterota bacterium]|nr:hypothetical protein [Candidatus Paceibacterota bacterium]